MTAEEAVAVAGGAIALALVDRLVERGVLSRDEALAILADAQKRCIDLGSAEAALVVGAAYSKVLQAGL